MHQNLAVIRGVLDSNSFAQVLGGNSFESRRRLFLLNLILLTDEVKNEKHWKWPHLEKS